MLKRLELIGFKSFAERTVFEFGPGITAIVGPNGSGKSNIVDAVRWILGEQSAKSLRGGEMADVIFNGSSTRRSLGFAEVTLTLDNSQRLLAIDSDEVQITRRVYRSGEGEYLINKQPSRLRDIKELFLGSGAGAEAYCVIAQGRIEAILQATNKERRVIFEEAAGISRFKAKKIETLRKLEQADQNLLRVRDVLEEVDRQLRSVKQQAAKAQRYQEYADRLRQLRLTLALHEYDSLTRQLAAGQQMLDQARSALREQTDQVQRSEQALRKLEEELEVEERRLRDAESAVGDARRRITAAETVLEHERDRLGASEQELSRLLGEDLRLGQQVADLRIAFAEVERQLAEAEAAWQALAETAAQREEALRQATAELAQLRKRSDQGRADLLEHFQAATRLHNEQISLQSQIGSLRQHSRRLEQQSAQAASEAERLAEELRKFEAEAGEVTARLLAVREEVTALLRERDAVRHQAERAAGRLVALREERSVLQGRVETLEELERKQEGVGAGVQQVLGILAAEPEGPWATVLGLLADLIRVEGPHAPLIDLVLGDLAYAFVYLDASDLHQAFASLAEPLRGRVTFVPVGPDGVASAPHGAGTGGNPASLSTVEGTPTSTAPSPPGILARAVDLVTVNDERVRELVRKLLERIAIVEDFEAARQIVAQYPGWTCITARGELLRADGICAVGKPDQGFGIISRRSELHELRKRTAALEQEMLAGQRELAALRDRLAQFEAEEIRLTQTEQEFSGRLAVVQSHIQQISDRLHGFSEDLRLSRVELAQVQDELQRLERTETEVQTRLAALHQHEAELRRDLEQTEAEIARLEEARQNLQQETVAAQVAAAKAEERRQAVTARSAQVRREYEQRLREHRHGQELYAQLRVRLRQSQLLLLQTTSEQAEAYRAKEQAQMWLEEAEAAAADLRRRRQEVVAALQNERRREAEWQEQVHTRSLEVNDLNHRRATLSERLREEQEADLEQLYQHYQPAETPLDRAALEEAIQDLRQKIARLGNVSLDSLQELQELEGRAASLQSQVDDLTRAKAALEEIIGRINTDSRRLFTEMFETIRGHFQELFRKLFGGGMADIVLENPEDVLESGIEIIARPPGKELRSISLLSGGEKTLTAVALLLAIFRSKPSPFCILDEVDAALDEANTGRFAAVLREFTDRSQFIMVTHSKRTMAMADVLYGVTMQEAGVSKRVSVRLDEWPENGAA